MGVLYYFCNDVELLVFGMVDTAQKMKFPLRVSSVKCDEIRRKLWDHICQRNS